MSTLLCSSHTKFSKCIISFYYSQLCCFRSWKRPFWQMEQKILEVPFCKNWLWDFCVDALEIMTFQLLITRCFCVVCLGRSVRWPWLYIQYFLLIFTQGGWNAGSIRGKGSEFLVRISCWAQSLFFFFWRMFCILSNHLNLQYVYCPCVVLAKDIENQNVIWLSAGLDKSKVIMAPRNFLLESSIFQSSSSSDPLFFPENPHLTVTVCHRTARLLTTDSLNTRNCCLMAIHGQLNCHERLIGISVCIAIT